MCDTIELLAAAVLTKQIFIKHDMGYQMCTARVVTMNMFSPVSVPHVDNVRTDITVNSSMSADNVSVRCEEASGGTAGTIMSLSHCWISYSHVISYHWILSQ